MTIKAASSQDMRELAGELRAKASGLRVPVKTPNIGQAFGNLAMERNAADASLYERAAEMIDQAAAQRKGLVEALEPFASFVDEAMGPESGYRNNVQREVRCINDFGTIIGTIYPGNFRDAHKAYHAALPPEGKSETSEIEAQP